MRLQLVDVVRQHGVSRRTRRDHAPGQPWNQARRRRPERRPASRRCSGSSPVSTSPTPGRSCGTRRRSPSATSRRSDGFPAGESVRGFLARRTGVDAAERRALEAAAARSPRASTAADRYAAALERFLALGGGDLDVRAADVLAELGLPVALDRRGWHALGRRGRQAGARGDPALALRRAAPGRADERPRLRRARAAGAVRRRRPRRRSSSSRTTARSSTGP